MILAVSPSQEDTGCEETLDTTWAEALPFVPGQGYHGDGKFIEIFIAFLYFQICIRILALDVITVLKYLI